MDGPWSADEQARHDRIAAAAATLPEPTGEAFRVYRRRGLDFHWIAVRLDVGHAEAEMHLSDAMATLIARLGKDALPRSLRPDVDAHPRHNLHLYHRPGDHDRLLAVSRYRYAVAYAEMMMEADARERSSVVVNQGAYAAEFALKSVLLHAGYSDDWNRQRIGLDIEAAFAHATGCGLPTQLPDLTGLIAPLARYHRGGRTAAGMRDVLAAMPSSRIAPAIRGLLDAVGVMTGYAGLPGEWA
jgi:hypothetical protein